MGDLWGTCGTLVGRLRDTCETLVGSDSERERATASESERHALGGWGLWCPGAGFLLDICGTPVGEGPLWDTTGGPMVAHWSPSGVPQVSRPKAPHPRNPRACNSLSLAVARCRVLGMLHMCPTGVPPLPHKKSHMCPTGAPPLPHKRPTCVPHVPASHARPRECSTCWRTLGKRVARIWQALGKRSASAWPAPGQRLANAWQARGNRTANA